MSKLWNGSSSRRLHRPRDVPVGAAHGALAASDADGVAVDDGDAELIEGRGAEEGREIPARRDGGARLCDPCEDLEQRRLFDPDVGGEDLGDAPEASAEECGTNVSA